MNKKLLISAAALTGMLGASITMAGGNLDTFKFTNESSVPGTTNVEIVPIRWDPRCANVSYTLDTVLPNAGTENEIDIETTRQELQAAFDKWNEIPTSFIELNITEVRTLGNGLRSFDFINELTFETAPDFGALASSPSMSLQEDTDFRVGDDIDEDGDSDVFDPAIEGRNTCFDADGDGDIEFPAGFYQAGTILDNDVQFSQTVLWGTQPNASTAADIQAIAVHEFGHSHGLSHTALNQISVQDGTGATMFPFIDTGDEASEAGTRTLHEDDIAWSSFNYPEGSQESGIGALQDGDIAFDSEYVVLRGEVTRSDGIAILGGNVFAISNDSEKRVEVDTITGTALALRQDSDGVIILAPEALGAVNGNYVLPVREGNYNIGLQALDGSPVLSSRISTAGNIGGLYGQQVFPEEFISTRSQETNIEEEPGRGRNVPALLNRQLQDLNFVVNEDVVLNAFGTTEFVGTGRVIGQSDVIYATRFSNANILELLESDAILTTAQVETNVLDASVVPRFQRVALVTGRIVNNGNADIDTGFAFREERNFIGQEGDDTPFFFNGAKGLSGRLINELRRDSTLDLFVIVEADNNFETGSGGLPPLVGVDTTGPFGDSFLSLNGGEFEPVTTLNFAIQLRFTAASR